MQNCHDLRTQRFTGNGCDLSAHPTCQIDGLRQTNRESDAKTQVLCILLFPSNCSHFCQCFFFLFFLERCELIALGNGTACRETESWITELMRQQILDSNSTKYCIVSECGASIYSCSEVAKNEFPTLDVNLISAGKFTMGFAKSFFD